MPIRWRLALFGTALTAAALLVFALLLGNIVGPGIEEDQDKLLTGLAEAAVVSFEATDGEPGAVVSPIVAEATTSDQPFVVVTDEDGSVRYTTVLVGGEPPRLPAAMIVEALDTGSSEATAGEIRYQVRRWIHPTQGIGVVAAGQTTRVVEQQLSEFRVFLIVFALITLIAAAVVAWVVSGRALRPLKTLAATTDEIGRTGDLTRRLPAQTATDEVGVLTASFNAMLERLQDTRDQLETSLQSQRRFVADASHELRSPLTTIRTNAGFLARDDVTEEDRLEAVEDIAAEADRMSRLVDDLLTLARGDSGATPEFAPVALGPLVVDVRRTSRHLDGRLSVSVEGAPVVDGDEDLLTRLVRILLDNAERHGTGAIGLTVTRAENTATIAVTDDGPGVSDEERERIFDRFYQADTARSGPGFGLGLAIACAIVELHSGSISAENREGGGAQFTVTLPLAT
ncbi:MAG: HAMP domain-containing sensor histidine kinase [Acidimicrobiia bacterium]|nr:MAG: HAMP domain-containing sensor histidine kinase [Acidimicrobiia bacterium]